jgi:hypothetical protein
VLVAYPCAYLVIREIEEKPVSPEGTEGSLSESEVREKDLESIEA